MKDNLLFKKIVSMFFCRNPNQYYVYHVAEGPQYIRFAVHKEFLEFDNFFNLTCHRGNQKITI